MNLFRKKDLGLEEVGYWRKANAIHGWFVENVQDGVDECQLSDVPRQKLEELLETCKRVMEETRVEEGEVQNGTVFENGVATPIMEKGFVVVNPEVCEELLPARGGFFFGSTDYNEYYMEDVKRTIEILEKALSVPGDEYAYQASW